MMQPKEPFSFVFTDVGRSEEQTYVARKGFPLAYRAITDELMVPLSSRMMDLLRLASTIYMVDRMVKRNRRQSGKWARHLKCSLAVRDMDFWTSASVSELVKDSAEFVSGDQWEFDIVPDATEFEYQWQRPLPGQFVGAPRVCLYSGGLDSAAGLVRRLSEGTCRQIIPVTIRHRTDLGSIVSEQIASIAQAFDAEIRPVTVPFEMKTPKKVVGNEETSQRARAFLFISVGGVVASAAGSSVLEMYESGIGAINAPLLAGMEGSQATRSAHPTFLKMMSGLLAEVSGRSIDVQLPFQPLTKSEVVRSLSQKSLRDVAHASASCVAYPLRQASAKSCGLCPACIFRRVALHEAGIEEPSSVYHFDLLDPCEAELPRRRMKYLLAFLNQIDSFSAIPNDKLPISVSKHLSQTGLLGVGDSQKPFVDLFSKYHSEWLSFIRTAKDKGCQWSNLIDLPNEAA